MSNHKTNNLMKTQIIRNMLIGLSLTFAFGSCHIYKSYERPEGVSASDSLYRQPAANGDTTSLASLSWKELFADPLLQQHIDSGLKNNADMRIALLKVKEAEAALLSSKMTYLPSLSLGADGSVGQFKGESTPKSYSLAMSASWEIDLFGKIMNEKRGAEAVLWQNTAYSQAVQTQLVATIANSYYMLLMLDEQLAISRRTSENWSDYVRTLQALKTFGTVTDAAIAQAEASQLSLEGSVLSLQQQIQSVENSLSVLLGKAPGRIERTTLDEKQIASLQRAVKSTQLLMDYGSTNYLEVLIAQQDLLQAELTMAEDKFNEIQGVINLYHALGGGKE